MARRNAESSDSLRSSAKTFAASALNYPWVGGAMLFTEFKRSTILQTLKRCPLLKELSPDDLSAVMELSVVKLGPENYFLLQKLFQ